MRNVRDILRGLRNDTTVGEKKPWDGKVEPSKASAPVPAEQRPPDVRKVLPSPVIYLERPPQQEPTYDVLDPTCEHQWSWKNGTKHCWLCGGPAPLDRRDKSTSWQANVYGKK